MTEIDATEVGNRLLRSLPRLTYATVGNKRRHVPGLRLPATINPDDRDKWRGFAASYAHLGRSIEMFAHDAVDYATFVRGRHAARTISAAATDAEAAAFRAELPGIFPEPADQPLPVVRLSSQAGLASVRGGL